MKRENLLTATIFVVGEKQKLACRKSNGKFIWYACIESKLEPLEDVAEANTLAEAKCALTNAYPYSIYGTFANWL